jgi:hypothetical protein
MHKTIAIKLVGGLSHTTKMPGSSYGLPTANCKIGAALAKIKGTVCNKCYAKRGFYLTFANAVVPAQQRRLASLDNPQWVEAMVKVLDTESWFRWFDSGDLQSVQMLRSIVEVARRTPNVKHWLATREIGMVKAFLKEDSVPDNLVIRLSATWPDVPVRPIAGVQSANVHKHLPPVGHECMAPQQHGKCDKCRACWDKNVQTVSYHEH